MSIKTTLDKLNYDYINNIYCTTSLSCNNLELKSFYSIYHSNNTIIDDITNLDNNNILFEKLYYLSNKDKLKSIIISNFLLLLKKHINDSKNKDYLNELNKIYKNIAFKYNYNQKNINYLINNKEIERTNELINLTINKIISYNNDDLENDTIYAKAMSLGILLRSMLLVSNKKELINYYKFLCKKYDSINSIALDIIKSSFIANNYDKDELLLAKIPPKMVD